MMLLLNKKKMSRSKKLIEQKKNVWIKNIMKIYEVDKQRAEELYNKIKPYEVWQSKVEKGEVK